MTGASGMAQYITLIRLYQATGSIDQFSFWFVPYPEGCSWVGLSEFSRSKSMSCAQANLGWLKTYDPPNSMSISAMHKLVIIKDEVKIYEVGILLSMSIETILFATLVMNMKDISS